MTKERLGRWALCGPKGDAHSLLAAHPATCQPAPLAHLHWSSPNSLIMISLSSEEARNQRAIKIKCWRSGVVGKGPGGRVEEGGGDGEAELGMNPLQTPTLPCCRTLGRSHLVLLLRLSFPISETEGQL